jgi:5'-nucleotidase
MVTTTTIGLVAASLAAVVASAPAQAAPDDSDLVISEVYGGGNQSSGTPAYNADYVEIYNPTAGSVDLLGYHVIYRSASGGVGGGTSLRGTLPAGGRYLVQMSGTGAAGATLPVTPDRVASPAVSMATAGGQVLLTDRVVTFPVGDLTGVAGIVDMVGSGDGSDTPNAYEGADGPSATNTNSVSRASDGTDTDDNSDDFAAGAPSPEACGCTGAPGAAAGLLSISAVQGPGYTTPYLDRSVTIRGVVTASYPTGGFNGFVVQTFDTGNGSEDPTPGSDAIYVQRIGVNPAVVPAVGTAVEVTGTAIEGGGQSLGLTQITAEEADVTATPLIDPVAATTTAWPDNDDDREGLESLWVKLSGGYTVTNSFNTSTFGEIGLASGSGPLRQPTDVAEPGTPAAEAVVEENAARGVILDDGASTNYGSTPNSNPAMPWLTPTAAAATTPTPVRVGQAATLPGNLIVDYRNNNWKVQPTTHVTGANDDGIITLTGNPRNPSPANVGGDLTLASFNVLNYFNTTGEAWEAAKTGRSCTYFVNRTSERIAVNNCSVATGEPTGTQGPRGAATTASLGRQQAKIVRAINNLDADIVSLEEIEQSLALGETDRDDAVKTLVNALNVQADTTRWAYAPSPPQTPSFAEEDVIRTAFIYNPNTVDLVGASRILIDTVAPIPFANAREPLAQAFKPAGASDAESFAVVANHFKSKSAGSSSGSGNFDSGDGQGAFNADRVAQATQLVEFANSFAATRGTDKVFLAGDFNSYTYEDPMQVLYDAGFDVIQSDTPGEYSYSFSGLSGTLDHILANGPAQSLVTGADLWEINANESVGYQYSRYRYNVTDLYAATPYASSDHNPTLVGIRTDAPSDVTKVQVLGMNDFHGRLTRNPTGAEAGAAVLAGAVDKLRQENPNTVWAAAGDLIGASTFESFIQNDKPTIDALNAAGLDVSSVGNHEFDQGYDDLVNRVMADDNPEGGAEWKYLGANVRFKATGNPALPATWIKSFDGVDIGFVGAVTEHLPELVSPDGIAEIMVTDIVEETNAAAIDLKEEGADLVILLVHEGAATTSYASAVDPASDFGKIVNGVSPDVDAIISGHTHLAYNHRVPVPAWAQQDRAITKRPVVSSGQYGFNLNQLRYRFDADTGEPLSVRTRILALQSPDGAGNFSPNYSENPVVKGIVDDAVAVANVLGAQELGKIGGAFRRPALSATADARGRESTLGNLVAEVQRWATESPTTGSAQIAFMNPGGLRADMVPGAGGVLTYRQAANVQPFANTLVNMDMTGAQIKLALQQQLQPVNASRPFLRLGVSEGFTYTYRLLGPSSAPTGMEVGPMFLDGEPIDLAATYSVTVNSFLASGGDNFGAFAQGTGKQDTGKTDLQGMVDYMAAFASSTPLPVDYSQRAVGVVWPGGAPAADYAPGGTVAFDLTSLDMTATGDLQDDTVKVLLDGEELGSATIDHAPGVLATFDEWGTASVSVDLPDDVASGAHVLEVTGDNAPDASTGTVALVPITVAGGAGPGPGPGPGPDPTPTKVATAVAADAPSVQYGEASMITATVTPATAAGTVRVLLKGTVVGTATLSAGKATISLAGSSLSPGAYPLQVAYEGNATHQASSTTITHVVTKATPTMTVKAPKKVEVGDRAKVKVKLAVANDVPLKGRVELTIKGGQTLKGKVEDGKVVFKLPKAQANDVGSKIKVVIVYGGTNLVDKARAKASIKVVDS